MAHSEAEYRAYMLRLWQAKGAAGGCWHASLQSVESGELNAFASLNKLVAYLKEITGEVLASDEASQELPLG